MLVVHLTYTPLAGAPIRIVNALNAFTNVKARLINLNPNAYNSRVFPEDLIWQQDKNIALSLISAADIIVCHHPMDLVNNKFGISLKNSPNLLVNSYSTFIRIALYMAFRIHV